VSPDRRSPDLDALDHRLRSVQFEPRASLGAELEGRARRGEQAQGAVSPLQSFAVRSALALVGAAAVAALVVGVTPPPRHLDVCCQDLVGNPAADDGMELTLDPRGRVTSMLLYEDLDGSRSRTAADRVLFLRGSDLDMAAAAHEDGHDTYVQCCEDLDGEGLPDDGVLVMGHLPDQIHFAALIRNEGHRRVLR
jgi:hypothetical protein